ncbi:MAG: HAMP domain-containing histidine kinase [Clostridiales bacterium]|nr:HAMP domain-containing histidine kinase [Clostridiales bacterium]
MENIADEAGRMSELVDNLLALAKAEEKQATVESFDLVAAVCEEADRVEAFLFEKGVAFGFEMRGSDGGLGGSRVTAVGEASAWIASGSDGGTVGASETLTVRTDRAKVQAALSVLLENAVKYTPPGGRVTIAIGGGAENLARNGSGSGRHKGAAVDRMDSVKRVGAYVSVSNTGPYIPPDDLEHIFDRFFRSDPSRSSETGGHGIGLSIAKELARSIGGDLTAASTPQADGEAVNTFTLFI